MDSLDMFIKTSEFYEAEAERLLEKLQSCNTKKQALSVLEELASLKQKMKFEINQISKIIEDNAEY